MLVTLTCPLLLAILLEIDASMDGVQKSSQQSSVAWEVLHKGPHSAVKKFPTFKPAPGAPGHVCIGEPMLRNVCSWPWQGDHLYHPYVRQEVQVLYS